MLFPMTSEISRLDFPRRLFTVDEVSQMVEKGILREGERVELLDGDLLVVSPQGPAHSARLAALAHTLTRVYGDVAHPRTQMPLDARPYNLPEPDLAVVRGQPLDYQHRHPVGADTLLLIEVANTSQALDRRKIQIYAAAGVPVYWLVDLVARQIEVFSAPTNGGIFARRRVLGPEEEVELPEVGVRLAVSAIVG